MATERHAATLPPGLHPAPTPPRIVDMMRRRLTSRMFSVLDIRFGRRKDVLVAGFGYLRRDPMDDSERFAPNVVVAFGVDPKAIIARNGYIISEAGKPPDFIMEVATRFSATPGLSRQARRLSAIRRRGVLAVRRDRRRSQRRPARRRRAGGRRRVHPHPNHPRRRFQALGIQRRPESVHRLGRRTPALLRPCEARVSSRHRGVKPPSGSCQNRARHSRDGAGRGERRGRRFGVRTVAPTQKIE